MFVILVFLEVFEAIIAEILFDGKEIFRLWTLALIFTCYYIHFICVAFFAKAWTSVPWGANLRFFRNSLLSHFCITT